MSLDDYQEDGLPWLCDECGDKHFRVVGWLVVVKRCKKCAQEKCPHCFDDEKSELCTKCMDS